MRLPHLESAVVSKEKVFDYLLSISHRDGRHKATFFARFGFTADEWYVLADALRQHARDHEVAKIEDSPFGRRYVVDGKMPMADGRDANVRTVWFIERGGEVVRFVTASPLGG